MFREPRNTLPKVFTDKRIEVRESSIHRWGVFAKENIPAHTIIESSPVVLCHNSLSDVLFEINNCRHVLQDYPFAWKDGMLAYAMGWAALYNHQRENNAMWKQNYEYETVEFTTKREILAEEEITVRYLPVRLRGALWFNTDEDDDLSFKDVEEASNIRGGKHAIGPSWKDI